MNPLNIVIKNIQDLKRYVLEHGAPACVSIEMKYIRACERHFPLTEGNDAETEIDYLRIWAELNGLSLSEHHYKFIDVKQLTLHKIQ